MGNIHYVINASAMILSLIISIAVVACSAFIIVVGGRAVTAVNRDKLHSHFRSQNL